MKQKQKPLSFSLHPDNIAYIEAAVLKQKEANHRYSRSMYLDDLITHLRLKAEVKYYKGSPPKPTANEIKQLNKKEPVKRFKEPTALEVDAYMVERGLNNPDEAVKFCDHFISNGWKVGGKGKMKCWKAAVRNWLRGNGNGRINENNARSGQKESSHERIKRENDVKYRGQNECGLGMGETDGDLGRTVDKGQRVETVIGLDNEPFIDY